MFFYGIMKFIYVDFSLLAVQNLGHLQWTIQCLNYRKETVIRIFGQNFFYWTLWLMVVIPDFYLLCPEPIWLSAAWRQSILTDFLWFSVLPIRFWDTTLK
jgi:hypothetical protein